MVTRYCAPLCAVGPLPLPPILSFILSAPSFLLSCPSLSLSLSPIPSINQRQVMAIFASISLPRSTRTTPPPLISSGRSAARGEERRDQGRGREWRIMPPPPAAPSPSPPASERAIFPALGTKRCAGALTHWRRNFLKPLILARFQV